MERTHRSDPRKSGRPALLSDSEVLTLALLAQWPRWHGESTFWPAKVAAYTVGQMLDVSLERPLRHLADLLV